VHNEKLHDLYSSPSIIRIIKSRTRWAGNVARIWEKTVRKPVGKRPLGRARHRWVNDIRMDLVEVGWGYLDWIGLVQDRNMWRNLVNPVLNLQVALSSIQFVRILHLVGEALTALTVQIQCYQY
jgi:hypothetical protein